MEARPTYGRSKWKWRPTSGKTFLASFGVLIFAFAALTVLQEASQNTEGNHQGKTQSFASSLAREAVSLRLTQASIVTNLRKMSPVHPRPTLTNSKTRTTLLVHMILLLSGDVEINLGPSNAEQEVTAFPCPLCHTDVSCTADALQCEGCELWLHRTCMNMSSTEYGRLGEESAVWLCGNCGLRNISSTLFRT